MMRFRLKWSNFMREGHKLQHVETTDFFKGGWGGGEGGREVRQYLSD